MTTSRPPIVRSKLRAPAPTPDLVVRMRLITRLLESSAPIWVVTAPAGFGKTTLIVRTLEEAEEVWGVRTAWVSVDRADGNPARFWTHVVAALVEAGVAADPAIGPLLDDDVDRALDEIVVAIEAVPTTVVLVLDDVHEIEDERVLLGLERLVARPPEGLLLAMTTRHELDLGLARRRLHGDVVELSAVDLAFTAEEGRRALAGELGSGVLDDGAAAELVSRLDGWPAGVRLSQLALRSDAPASLDAITGSSPEVATYLASEVLGGLSADVRDFLLDTSILMDLTPGVCDSVSGRSDSLAVLRTLAADQVFTSLVDPATSTFRLHRLFREFLVGEAAERPPEEMEDLHRRAMRWSLAADDLDSVVWHAVSAGEHEVALQAVGERLLDASNRGQIDDMWRWINWIGTERVLADSVLAALPAWVSLNQRRYDEIDPWLDAIWMVEGVSDDHLRLFAVHAGTIRASRDRHLGAIASAVESARQAVELADDAAPHWTIVSTVHATLAQVLALAGDADAVDAARVAIDLAGEAGQDPPLVMAYGALGMALDDPIAAGAAADSALSFVTSTDLERFHRPAMPWLVRAQVAFDEGRMADAEHAVERTIEIATIGDEPAVLALAHALCARIHHLHGREPEKRAALRSADAVGDELTGADWILEQVRAAHTATRFAPGPDDLLPIGARELSERELGVLRMLPYDLPRRELARQLYVSENTVKTHLTSIRRKLGLRGRADIVERARELGLLDDA
ncbi:MAG: LuxR C-terminal-related transcriptional regulator [Actinomycetota bacterium]